MKSILRRALRAGAGLTVLSVLLCAAALVCIFLFGWQETLPAAIVYAFTTYSFVMLIVNFPAIVAKARALVYKNKLGNRYFTDIPFQMKVTLYVSLSFNLLYAAFKLIAGVYYVSFWFSADAIFYIVLSIIRFTLLRHVREDEHDRKKGLLKYRLCGILLFVLNGAFIAVVYQIVRQGMRYEYRGPLIYAVAIYTFYCIIHSAVSFVRHRKMGDPVRSAQTAVSFAKALVALFALQTAMFVSFNNDKVLEQMMNAITGGAVCVIIFGMAIGMVLRANHALKRGGRRSR